MNKQINNIQLTSNSSKKDDLNLGTFYRKLIGKYRTIKIESNIQQNSLPAKINLSEPLKPSFSQRKGLGTHANRSHYVNNDKIFMPKSFKTNRKIHEKISAFENLKTEKQLISSSLDRMMTVEGRKSELNFFYAHRINNEIIKSKDSSQSLDQSTMVSTIQSKDQIFLPFKKQIELKSKNLMVSKRNSLIVSKHPIKKLLIAKNELPFKLPKNNKMPSFNRQSRQSISAWSIEDNYSF